MKDVISKWVLHEVEGIVRNLFDKVSPLVADGMVDATLEHAAATPMRSDSDTIIADRIEDELVHVSDRSLHWGDRQATSASWAFNLFRHF